MDLFDKCSQFEFIHEWKASGNYPYFIPFEGGADNEVEYRGRRVLMAGSNNYLGLSHDPRVKRAAIEATERYGTGCTGSRFLNGTLALHETLEAELAAFIGKDAALVFSTGFQVNLGVVSSLVGPDDLVLVDGEAHASILDGCRLASGEFRRFRHNDVGHLEKLLRTRAMAGARLVIVDGVYSMSGDTAPLGDITKVCREHGARLMVDDAHGFGVLGQGRGTAAHFGVTDSVDLVMGTFSKSLASLGGFIAGDREPSHYIKHAARSLIFSASISPSNAAAALAALDIVRSEPERISRLAENARSMRSKLRRAGFDISGESTPIVPIDIGEMLSSISMWRGVFDDGVYVNLVVPPAVPENRCQLRTSYTATNTEPQLEQIASVLRSNAWQRGLI